MNCVQRMRSISWKKNLNEGDGTHNSDFVSVNKNVHFSQRTLLKLCY